MFTDTRHWTSSCEGGSGVVTVPMKGALLAVISQRRRGRLRSGTTPRAWYWPITAAKSTMALRRQASAAQCSLSSFSCSAFGDFSAPGQWRLR
jgi:hypothetical protein